MTSSLIIVFAAFAYAAAGILMWYSVHRNNHGENKSKTVKVALVTALVALICHAGALLASAASNTPLDFSLSNMTLVISAMIMLIFLLGCLSMQIERLGVLMFPLAALSLGFALVWSGEPSATSRALLPLSAFSVHVLISILAYSMLTIALVQSLLYAYQEKQFKNRAAPSVLASLPPLQTMERLLFRLVGLGFTLLTLTLFTGALFNQQTFGQPFQFNHHTVLAALGWCVFATLMYKRLRHGLRGEQAAWWTITGFVLIQLGYFGTKFINESFNL